MIPETFADGIGRVGFSGGMVRLDLVSFTLEEPGEDGKPNREPRQRLILSPQAFIEVHAAMEGMLQKLLEMGVVSRQQPAEGGEAAAVAAAPKSPNF